MDVVVRASEGTGSYWLRVRGTGKCEGLQTSSLFLYTPGINYTTSIDLKNESNTTHISPTTVFGQMLQSYHEVIPDSDVKSYYLGIDDKNLEFDDNDLDFRYISDALPLKPFFPAPLFAKDTDVVQINRKNFLYPSNPLLLNKVDRRVPICPVGDEDKVSEPQCLQLLNAKKGEVIELALVNEGLRSNNSYTFHMHGYGMQVVATSEGHGGQPLSKDEFMKLDKAGKITRNLQSPPIKDTITVPNKGYTIVRIQLHQGGSWLLECRSCGLLSLPAAIVIQVPQTFPKKVLDALPKCGSYKPPDVLLN
ncbi:hypothetical protein O0L34_g7297 [Tuta absoluta]|nr:hypothetical protein O0L34_g7297 [Tuta absoluta]